MVAEKALRLGCGLEHIDEVFDLDIWDVRWEGLECWYERKDGRGLLAFYNLKK